MADKGAHGIYGSGDHCVILLHGLAGDAESWEPVIAALAPKMRVLVWEMPGYGRAAPLAAMTWPGLADAVVATMDAHGLARAHLLGHSMGGMLAQEVCARNPIRVASLVLYATSPAFGKGDGPWQQAFVAERLAPLDAGKSMAEIAAATAATMIGENADAGAAAIFARAFASVRPETYRAALACLVTFDQRAALGRIAVPTLVIGGDRDRSVPDPVMPRMAAKIATARYHCIKGAGHIAHLEQPAAFARALHAFYASIDAIAEGPS